MQPEENRKPVQKSVVGGLTGAIALVVLYIVQQLGLEMDVEVAGAIALLLASGAAYLKRED